MNWSTCADDGSSILPIAWALLLDPETGFVDLESGFHDTGMGTERATRSHIRHLEALGFTGTLRPAA